MADHRFIVTIFMHLECHSYLPLNFPRVSYLSICNLTVRSGTECNHPGRRLLAAFVLRTILHYLFNDENLSDTRQEFSSIRICPRTSVVGDSIAGTVAPRPTDSIDDSVRPPIALSSPTFKTAINQTRTRNVRQRHFTSH